MLVVRTMLFYALILISLRILGKREVGNLSIFDVVVFLLIAEVASDTIHSLDLSVWRGIVPVAVLAAIQLSVAHITLKNKRIRDILEGEPALMIRDGIIQEEVMRQHRYNLDDLFQQLREQQIGSVDEVQYAYLESSGKLSIFCQQDNHLLLAAILDGEIQERHLNLTGHTVKELLEDLAAHGMTGPEEVFYAAYKKKELVYQLKSNGTKP